MLLLPMAKARQSHNTPMAGPYYPLVTTGIVPRAYDIFRAYEGMEGSKDKNKEMKKK
jgi:hypothetical protein